MLPHDAVAAEYHLSNQGVAEHSAWNRKVQELRDAESFEDAYALLQEFDVITSRSLEGGH